ncbi:conjugal transfer protein TrbD [Mesorhizobium sp. DCY119]|uniref:conjugal transfer protein TrbD n=1 Tax=Mesorhizobium sp. DCY119 TaxID=2108445 RepID=UPI001FDED8AC|nr:conjugal transfer protein TrbD [Mesorhizobium sp. DCY119]
MQQNLLHGADRDLVLLAGLAAATPIFVVVTAYCALLGVAILIAVVAALRMVAQADPMSPFISDRFTSMPSATSTGEQAWPHRTLPGLRMPLESRVLFS